MNKITTSKGSKPQKFKKSGTSSASQQSSGLKAEKSGACYRCGLNGHYGRDPKCPAKGQTCHKCAGRDHYAKVCKTKIKSSKVHQVEEGSVKLENRSNMDDYAFLVSGGTNSDF